MSSQQDHSGTSVYSNVHTGGGVVFDKNSRSSSSGSFAQFKVPGDSNLTGGLSVGSMQKPFTHQCPYCCRFFHTPSKLARHVRSHTGEKPFHCPYCTHRASDKSNLLKHIYSQHEMSPTLTNKNNEMSKVP